MSCNYLFSCKLGAQLGYQNGQIWWKAMVCCRIRFLFYSDLTKNVRYENIIVEDSSPFCKTIWRPSIISDLWNFAFCDQEDISHKILLKNCIAFLYYWLSPRQNAMTSTGLTLLRSWVIRAILRTVAFLRTGADLSENNDLSQQLPRACFACL